MLLCPSRAFVIFPALKNARTLRYPEKRKQKQKGVETVSQIRRARNTALGKKEGEKKVPWKAKNKNAFP